MGINLGGGVYCMDVSPYVCESSRSQLSHTQWFISKCRDFENSELFTRIYSTQLNGGINQSPNSRGKRVHCILAKYCALESARPQLSNAQRFISISHVVASECLTEHVLFSEMSQTFYTIRKIKQNPKATSFFNIQKYFAATVKILKKMQSYTKSSG